MYICNKSDKFGGSSKLGYEIKFCSHFKLILLIKMTMENRLVLLWKRECDVWK